MDAHSIIYHESDINLNADKNRKKRSDMSGGHENDDHLSCGSAQEHIRNNLVNEQKKLFDERRRVEASRSIIFIRVNCLCLFYFIFFTNFCYLTLI